MRLHSRSGIPLTGFLVFGVAAAAVSLAVPLVGSQSAASAAAVAASQDSQVAAFYRARDGAPLWLAPSSGAAAQQLLSLLETAQADHLNPKRYNVRSLSRALDQARGGDPGAVRRADEMLSEAFVAYARDQRHDPGGIIYVDPQLRPTPPSAAELLSAAARAPSLSDYVQNMGWMNPIYAKLRAAIASRLYGSDAQRRILELNLERARALPSGNGRYVIVNPPAARLYMYENGQVVDSMRVVAGRPDPVAQTPMMNAYIRYVALNPYWNSPPDITSRKLAPTILKEGRAYFTKRGYDLVDHFGPDAHVLNPMSVDWRAVAAGRLQVNLRQRPGPAGNLAPRHSGEGEDRGCGAAAEQRLRSSRSCAAPRALAVQWPAAQSEGREAGAEGQSAHARAALHHLSDGGAERDVDRLFRRFLRQGSHRGAPLRRPVLRIQPARRSR
jgi:murein L,D-transpeptidase YcbB/YkuD